MIERDRSRAEAMIEGERERGNDIVNIAVFRSRFCLDSNENFMRPCKTLLKN